MYIFFFLKKFFYSYILFKSLLAKTNREEALVAVTFIPFNKCGFMLHLMG